MSLTAGDPSLIKGHRCHEKALILHPFLNSGYMMYIYVDLTYIYIYINEIVSSETKQINPTVLDLHQVIKV